MGPGEAGAAGLQSTLSGRVEQLFPRWVTGSSQLKPGKLGSTQAGFPAAGFGGAFTVLP